MLLPTHQEVELRDYWAIVMDLFQAVPANPFMAISFDVQVHDKYSKKPFHHQLNIPLLVQMPSPATPNPPCTNKRSISSQAAAPVSNSKCMEMLCCNWSFGTCKAEICLNCCKHGICCICGKGHQEQRIMSNALPSSNLTTEYELLGLQEDVTRFMKKGPVTLGNPSLKCKAAVTLDFPQFHCGFVWSDNSDDYISPSAFTESVPPLPSLPQHLLDDPVIQESVTPCTRHIQISPSPCVPVS